MKVFSWCLIVLSVLPARAVLGVESSDQQFVRGLVERRLFELAELACSDQLSDAELSPRERVDWTVELMRVLGQHAANSVPASREALWQQAHEAARTFLEQHPDAPYGILVQVQDALTALGEGELARWEAEVAPQPQEALDRARVTIRQATRQMEELDHQLTERIARAAGRSDDSPALTSDELFALQNHVRFQLARAFRNQGLCYPPESDDRLSSISRAIEQLKRTMSQLRAGDPLAWQAYLDLAHCYRLLGQWGPAQRTLTPALAAEAPDEVRRRALAEQALVAVATGEADAALATLNQARAQLTPPSAEVDLARLEALLALWTTATNRKDEAAASRWQREATAAVDAIERDHGSYWGRRAELQLLRVAGTGSGDGNVDILGRTADNLYKKGQREEAIVAYQRGAQLARAARDIKTAFELEYKAALIEQEMKQYQAAAQRLQRLALDATARPEAASTHILAAWNAGQAARSDPEVAQYYGSLLEEHLREWPSDATANIARDWLGRLREGQQQWEAAVAAYQGITPDAEQFETAVAALARCWDQWLQQRQTAQQPIGPIVDDATRYFDQLILGPENRWPERWSNAQRTAAVATARLRLKYEPDGRDAIIDAQRVLQAALQTTLDSSQAWRNQAQSLLVVALAAQPGRQAEARQLLEQLGAESFDHLLEVIQGLSSLVETAAPPVKSQLAQLQLAALDKLASGGAQLDGQQRLRMEQIRADALRAAGNRDAALAVLNELASNQPNNRRIQIDYARLLLEGNDAPTLSQAIVQWQKIARRLPPDTDAWYEAKYSFAYALYKRNQQEDRSVAARQLRYLKATSNVDASDWREKVDRLLSDSEGH